MFQWLIVLYGIAAGIYASYTDIRKNLIKNRLILSIILVGTMGHTYFILNSSEPLKFPFLLFLEYFALAFFLYWFEILPSGDAKLFASMGFLLPITFYRTTGSLFPIKDFTINSFLPLSIGLLFFVIRELEVKRAIFSLKNLFKPKNIGWLIFRIFSLSGFVGFLMNFIGLTETFLLSGFLIVGLMAILNRVPYNEKILYLPFCAFTLFYFYNNFLRYIYSIISGFLIYGTFRILIMNIANASFTHEIKIRNLKPGMVLAENIFKSKEGYKKRFSGIISIFSPLFHMGRKNNLIEMRNEGLTREDVERLKKLNEEEEFEFDAVRIHETLPFAPFILFGFILSLLINTNVLILIFILMSSI